MTGHTVQREKLGSLTKIGQGGQGTVYLAPGFRTKFTNAMVFKEYKPDAIKDIDFIALAAMPVLVEESMSYEDAERLIAIAAWPCAIVEQEGKPIGQVMPAIPDRFTMPLRTAKGASQVNAEFQHLLNHSSILAAREITIDDEQRYSLLREVASELAFLHGNGICVGDISPKNLLFSLAPTETAYFIDCDTMSVDGVSALPQVETPGWEVPVGETVATVYADSYKLGLLALRLIVGDQDVRDPKRIPARTPNMLRQIIVDTLTKAPERRPLPTAWTYILGHAIEDAQQRKLDGQAAVEPKEVPAPAVPVVRSRPKPKAPPKAAPPQRAAQTKAAAAPVHATAARSARDAESALPSRNGMIGAGIGVAVAAAVAILVWAVVTVSGNDSNVSSRPSSPSAYGGLYDEPSEESTKPTPTTTTSRRGSWGGPATQTGSRPTPATALLSPPPSQLIPQDADANGQYCTGGIGLQTQGDHFAARGSEGTTCFFAENVGRAYASSGPNPGTTPEIISAKGSVGCSTVPGNPQCSRDGRDLFTMTCSVRGSDNWVTCTGGNKAVVYIY